MNLPQLVGMSCAVCGQRIGSTIDGRFCGGCGNPVHDRCSSDAALPASNDDLLSADDVAECPRCGAGTSRPVAVEVRRITLQQRVVAEIAPLQRTAELSLWWRFYGRLATLLGVVVTITGIGVFYAAPDPAIPDAATKNRSFAYLAFCFGTVFILSGFLFGWFERRANRMHQAVGEDEEPPG